MTVKRDEGKGRGHPHLDVDTRRPPEEALNSICLHSNGMLGFLSPKRVAAKKLARIIAQKQPARAALAEAKVAQVEPTSGAPPLDPLENLLDQELRKYGISLG